MVRKNVHIPDALASAIGQIRHDAQFASETKAVVSLLEGAVSEIRGENAFVYLAASKSQELLKIGFSKSPAKRIAGLKSQAKDIELLTCLQGSRLLETACHMLWRKYAVGGEWFRDSEKIRRWFDGHDFKVDAPPLVRNTFNVFLTQETLDRLDRLKDMLEAQSRSEVVRRALQDMEQAHMDKKKIEAWK